MDSALPVLVPPLAAAIAAVMAAGLAWKVATPLVRAADGPTLPERLLQWAGQHRFVALLAYLPAALSGRHALWTIPLAWLGLQVTAHRVRRRVFGDTWSFAGQVWWNARAVLAIWTWWLTVMFLPGVLVDSGAGAGAAVAAGIGLLAWLYFHNDVLGAILGARPIDAPVLLDAFEPILGKARIRRPRLLHAGPRGGLIINAFALGSLRGDAVLFLDGLLDEMTPAESAAVLAHEIGHLEDFATRRWQVHGLGPLLVAGAVGVTLAVVHYGGPAWIATAWCAVPLVALLLRVARAQQRESDSDARAVELCGDGEALIRALTRIHSRARVPRRFDPTFSEHATHPSLARRIQAIRAASGVPPAPIEARAFAGDGVRRGVIFEAERIVFVAFDSEQPDLADLAALVLRASHVDAFAYGALSSLHIEPRRDGGATLIATDRRGGAQSLRIADRDIAAVQALLDVVDQRIGPPQPTHQLSQAVGRIAACAAFLAAMPLLAWGVIATTLLALVRPTAAALAAIASGLFAAALVAMRHPSPPWRVPALILIAVAAAVVALRQIRRERATEARFEWDVHLLTAVVVTIAAGAIPLWIIVVLGHDDAGRLHVAARAFASGASGFAALAGLCLVVPRRLARLGAVLALATAAAIIAVGSNAFRDRVVPDPFVAAAPPLAVQDLSNATGELSAAGSHWHVVLGPDARHAILTPGRDEGRSAASSWTIAGFDGWQRAIEADDVRFVDADTVLVARWQDHGVVLSAEPVRAAEPRWTLRIDGASLGKVDVDRSGRWRLEPEMDADAGDGHDDPVRLEGRVGTLTVVRTPLPRHDPSAGVVSSHGVDASGAGVDVAREFTGSWHRLSWLLPDAAWNSVLTRSGGAPATRSRLNVECYGPSLTSASAACLATTGDETFVWEVPAGAAPLQAVAALNGSVFANGADDRALLLWHDGDLLLVWRGTNHAVRIASSRRCPCAHDASYAAGHVATLTRVGDRDVVRRYASPPPRLASR